MHVVFVSSCESKAIKKTRAVIDRYATRIADRAWASPFTIEALNEIHQALKRSATRQTSVACYKNNGRDGLKIIWIVGNKNAYDDLGSYAIETRQNKKEFPLYLRHAALLAQASGLGHDLGKANKQFRAKLLNLTPTSDKVRHEWISAWLLKKMDGNFSGESLKEAWSNWENNGLRDVTKKNPSWIPFQKIENPFDAMVFCVATHHRMFGDDGYVGTSPPDTHGNNNHINHELHQEDIKYCTIQDWQPWGSIMEQLSAKYERIKAVETTSEYWRGVALIARACLVLADHEISSFKYTKKSNTDTWANSVRVEKGKVSYNQPLTYHLEMVGNYAAKNIAIFSGNDLPFISEETRQHIESPTNEQNSSKYGWQDTAFSFLRERSNLGPSLIFNVAGTGSGKTFGNVKILAALNQDNLRITAGFNLRSLTLQTRDAYKNQIYLKDAEVGCIIGSGDNVIEKIHCFALDDDEDRKDAIAWKVEADARNDLPTWLSNLHSNDKEYCLKLIGTPVIVTTMDHLIEAGEPGKQAGHALAMMRISSSDLIIDEADSYDPQSLMAVLRIVEIAAMFGRNIVVSSATLPVVLADAINKAWQSGNAICKALKGAGDGKIYCISNKISPVQINLELFKEDYESYVEKIAIKTAESEVTKIFRVVEPNLKNCCPKKAFITRIENSIRALHKENHQLCDVKTISIGLIRVANVNPCIEIARALSELKSDEDIFVMAYHAREVLGRRAWKEKSLDSILTRKTDENGRVTNWWECNPEVQQIINKSNKQKIIFVVVATPVAEVGRDHDYDWAIIEPSSMTSIIQTSGRVNRHRLKTVTKPNIHILNMNWAYLVTTNYKNKSNCYSRPGHQIKKDSIKTHSRKGETLKVSTMLSMELNNDLRSNPCQMDVRLIFGKNKCIFSIEDDKGISAVIDGALSAFSDQKSWLNSWIYDAYKLREQQEQSKFIYDFSSKTIEKIEFYNSHKNGKRTPRTELVIQHPEEMAPKNTFFSPSLDFILEWLKENKKKISVEDLRSLGSFSTTGEKYEPRITGFGIDF